MEEYRLVYDLFTLAIATVLPVALVGLIWETVRGAR